MATSGTKEYLTAYEKDFIEKYDGEATGTVFDPTDTSKAKLVTISDDYASTVFSAGNYSALVTIDGSSRKTPIYITGNTLKNRISTGSGDDTLNGGDGNDTLTGGSGADLFITSQGKDFVTDYSATEGDKIKLNGVTATKVKVSKQNVVITNSDKSTFTIVNGKNVMLSAIDSNGNAIDALNQAFGDTEFKATSDTTVINASLNTSLKNIDASEAKGGSAYQTQTVGVTTGIVITGNSAANSIVGSNYINNTLIGGAGKDTLTGGFGTQASLNGHGTTIQTPVVNTFVFSEGQGTNVITNYQTSDRIWIRSGSITGYTTKGNDLTFTVALNGKNKTTFTVKDGKNKTITFLRSDGQVDTGNTRIYRNSTDYIVTTEESVTSALTGDKVKLIDASTSEYTQTLVEGDTTSIDTVTRMDQYGHKGVYLAGNKIANTIIGSEFEDTITGGAGKDTLYGGHSTVSGAEYHPDKFVYTVGDGADIIVDYMGTSDITKTDAIFLGPNTNIASSSINTKKGAADVILTTATPTGKNKSTLTLKNSIDQYITIVKSDGTTVSPQKYGQTSLKAGTDIYAVGNILDIGFNTKAVTLDASNRDTTTWLVGNSAKNVLIGSTLSGSTLQGAGGNDTLYGAKGQADIFLYGSSDGTDAIFDFESGTDLIKLASSDVHITASAVVTKKGANDVQLTIGKSKVLIKGIADTLAGTNAKGKAVTLYEPQKIKIADSEGTTYAMNYGSTLDKVADEDIAESGTLTFSANTQMLVIDAGGYIKDTTSIKSGTATVDGEVVTTTEVVPASSINPRTKAIHLIGNAKANTITGATNNGDINQVSHPGVITTMTGGKGNDVFILTTGGNLYITDYNANAKNEADKIMLTENQAINGSSAVTVDGRNDLVLEILTTTGDDASATVANNITLAGAREKEITIIDSNGATNTQTYGSDTIRLTNKTNKNILVDNSIIAVTNESRTKAITISSTGKRGTTNGTIPAAGGGLSIEGGKGNDTINGGPSDGGIVTITGGGGKDLFLHTNLRFTEIITDYEAGKDKIEFFEGMDIASLETFNPDAAGTDSDVHLHFTYTKQVGNVVTTGLGDITLQGAGGKKVTLVRERTENYVDKKGVTQTRTVKDESTQIFGAHEITVTDNDGSLIDASDNANYLYLYYVDASARSAKKPITIRGNATYTDGKRDGNLSKFNYFNKNTLIGGKGSDTIYSGKENPSGKDNYTEITGGAGGDYFYYYGGNVTITDYAWNKKAANSDIIVFPSDVSVAALSNLFSSTSVTDSLTPSTLTSTAANDGRIRFDGEDVLFIFGTSAAGDITDSLRVKNAKDKNIAIVNSTGETISSTEVYSNPYEWRIDNKTAATTLEGSNPNGKKAIYVDENHSDVTLNSIYTAISASARSKAATIQGAKANTQYVLTGGKAADKIIGNNAVNTLVGGKGNDTLQANGGGNLASSDGSTAAKYNILTGGDGKDVFYISPSTTSDEYDIITDYQVGKDVLRLPEDYFIITAENVSVRPDGFSQTTTLKGVQASVAADGSGGADIVKVKNKTVARNMTGVTPNDVRLIIGRNGLNGTETVGSVTVWDAGGYSSMVDLTNGVSVGAIGAYKITVAQESTNAKGKTVVSTSALDLVSTEVVVANADGTTIDVTANPNVVNIVPQTTKPVRSKAMYVIGNAKANSIMGTTKNDTLVGGGHSAETVDGMIDTLTGDKGNDVFILDGKGDVIITDYSAEKGNYDKVRLGNGVELTNGTASGSNLIFTYRLGTSSVNHHATLQGAASTKITLVSSDGQSGAQVYGADEISIANADGSKVDVSSNQSVKKMDASKRTKNVWLVGNANTSTILGGKKNDTIDTSRLSVSTAVPGAVIDAGAGADSVYGSTGADQVTLGAGNDTYITNGGNDTVTTGAGKDLIIYDASSGKSGQVVITDYDGKNDRIELKGNYTSGAYTFPIQMVGYTIETDTSVTIQLGYNKSVDVGGVDNVTLPAYSISLQNAASGKLSITDSQGLTQTLTLTDPYTLYVTNTDGSNIAPSVNTSYVNVDANKRTTPINIVGNANIASIRGGTKADDLTLNYAPTRQDATTKATLNGGKGNDTLRVGSSVADTISVYYAYTSGDGADVITNYRAGDVIALGSAKTKVNETKSQVKGDNYLLTIGSSVITLQGAAKTEISVLSYGETTPTKYNTQSSNSMRTTNYEERTDAAELFADDNVITYDTANDISSILQPEYQVTTQNLTTTTTTTDLSMKVNNLAAHFTTNKKQE